MIPLLCVLSDNLDDPENTDPAQDTWKEFGLRAIVTYSDGSTEYHYVPFNSDVTQWQFSSLTIVPKKATTKFATIEVQCVYDKNDNEAYFDNLSLVKEAAQTMAYDENGNLESVQASGSEGESAEYEDGNLTSVTTGGSGTFTYTYDDKDNVATASNGIVKESYTRDSYGNVLSSTMTNTYDALSRLSSQTRPMSRITYSYLAGTNDTTTGLVSAVTHSKVGSNSFSPITFGYAYDELGYITSYTQTGKQAVTYGYDVQGQLTSDSDPNSDLYYTYEYDAYGNPK